MRIVFWGSDSFAIPMLEALLHEHKLELVICQPDHPAGRKLQMTSPQTKLWAISKGIAVLQPEKLKNNDSLFQNLSQGEWDIFLVISYGKIIPERFLNIPAKGSFNLHASILPKLRGASPIESAIRSGFEKTGLSLQKMSARMDSGDVVAQREIIIDPDWDAGKLREELSQMGVSFVEEEMRKLQKGIYRATLQNEEQATFCYKIKNQDMRIDWTKKAKELHNQVRSLSPKIGARTYINGKMIKVWQSKFIVVLEDSIADFPDIESLKATISAKKPGEIVIARKGKLIVATKDGFLQIVKLQPENKKSMSANDFLNGFRIDPNSYFE